MKRFVFLISTTLLWAIGAQAQAPIQKRHVLGAAGSSSYISHQGSNYLVQQSIGQEGVIGTFRPSGRTFQQGFIQANHRRGATDASSRLQAVIFPNPFERELHVVIEDESPVKVWVDDQMGRSVYESSFMDQHEFEIPLPELSPGVYTVRIKSVYKQFVAKLVKL